MASVTPPSIAWCIQKGTYLSGSEWYRGHRPVSVLAQKENWLTFLATHFLPPEKAGEAWRVLIPIEGEEHIITPQVIVTRPIFALEGMDSGTFETAYQLTQALAYAQEAGQIVIADLDDHPYAWNAEYVGRIGGEKITDWSWHDDWLNQANAVICSTMSLMDVLGPRFPDQIFAYAPNLYDPFRYEVTAEFGRGLGSHLFPNARYLTDFNLLGEALNPLFEADPELIFRHVGEEFRCRNCAQHCSKARHYFDPDDPSFNYCADCSCEDYQPPADGIGDLAKYSGMPQDRIIARESVGLPELPSVMDWSVGVVPLADNEWNNCKTDGKGFEMAAAGIPFRFLGSHPLYNVSPGSTWNIRDLLYDRTYWELASIEGRQWAVRIAQEHEGHYRATMRTLSRTNLARV